MTAPATQLDGAITKDYAKREESLNSHALETVGECTAFRNGWNAALLSANKPAAPAGWKLVPIEPTEEMLERGALAALGKFLNDGPPADHRAADPLEYRAASASYAAMLAACPAAPAQSGEPVGEVHTIPTYTRYDRHGIGHKAGGVQAARLFRPLEEGAKLYTAPQSSQPVDVGEAISDDHASVLWRLARMTDVDAWTAELRKSTAPTALDDERAPLSQELIDHYWKMYKNGRMRSSGDHKEIFRQVLQSFADRLSDRVASTQATATQPAQMDDQIVKAAYEQFGIVAEDAEILAFSRYVLSLPAQTERALTDAPQFDAKHVSLKERADGKLVLTLLLDGVEGAPQYKVTPVNPGVVRGATQPASGGDLG